MTNSKSNVIKIVAIFRVLAGALALAGRGLGIFSRPKEENVMTPESSRYEKAVADYHENGLKGMWISYLEFQNVDFSSKEAFCRQMTEIFQNCKNMGLNTVIVHARAFGDAFYPSKIYPYSHIITGVQGGDPGFDPLAEMVEIAHRQGLRFEAWVNPYRVKLNSNVPGDLRANNPGNDESLLISGNDGVYYNPALPRVQTMVAEGVREIVENYPVDGIHFDDYFYPDTSLEADSRQYDEYLNTTVHRQPLSQEEWRRENVNSLIRQVYARIKEIDSDVVFGISPQGNNDNNYYIQYSDVGLWLSEEGYVDYIMPQLYWGFDYRTKSGSDRYAFENILSEWANMPRLDRVQLYIGLGAYRIGAGDGGSNRQDEWNSGENLSRMAGSIKANPLSDGYALYRYDCLFGGGEFARLQRRETESLRAFNRQG